MHSLVWDRILHENDVISLKSTRASPRVLAGWIKSIRVGAFLLDVLHTERSLCRFNSCQMRRFPPPWMVEKIAGGLKVLDANGQSLAYVYSRETKDAANIAGVLTEDEARSIASNIAKLPKLLGKG